jgi:tetratricopeptide (TPR) repeat protein
VNQNDIDYLRLVAGCSAEKAGDFHRAASEYREGLIHPSEDFDTSYFLNNNLGYSLIQIGEYSEAENYCREAISINPHRYNAHKNLGLALQGQGQYVEAALSLQLASVISNDPRAQRHLDELLSEHPEVKGSLKTYTIIEEKRTPISGQSSMVH